MSNQVLWARWVSKNAAVLFPAFVAILLSLPCLGYAFLWDDYHFLTNALSVNLRDWLPQSGDPFYRPISRALYFGVIAPLGTGGALLAHLMNLAYLAVAVTFLSLLCARMVNRRFGLSAGILFAGMYGIPSLVGWASCSQDLLAIDFVLLALLALTNGHSKIAVFSFVAALLSKETSVTALPALLLLEWVSDRKLYRFSFRAMPYVLTVLAWMAIHPAVRVLLARGLAPGATGYVGLTTPRTWAHFAADYLSVMANLRVGRFDPTWPGATTVYLALTAIGATVGFMYVWTNDLDRNQPTSSRRIVALGVLLLLPSLLMTSMMINSWGPYYAAFPMLGASLLGALVLERVRRPLRAVIIGVYLLLGIWARGSDLDSLHVTERALRPASDAIRKVERGFRTLAPTLPHNTDILLSVQVQGIPRVYAQMYIFQPPRIWYQDLSLRILKPSHVQPSDRPNILAIITPELEVAFMNPGTFEVRSTNGRPLDYLEAEKALEALAMGLGASGHTERGTRLLLRIPDPSDEFVSLHLRLAAMLQLAAGNRNRADSLLALAPAMPHDVALHVLNVILAEQPPNIVYDDSALHAFGIGSDDADALRDLANGLSRLGYSEPAHRFASRLLTLRPGDPIALRALAISDSLNLERSKWPEALR